MARSGGMMSVATYERPASSGCRLTTVVKGEGLDEPIVVALAEDLRERAAERIGAVSRRVRIAWVSAGGEPRDDVSDVQVIYRVADQTDQGRTKPVAAFSRAYSWKRRRKWA